MNYNKKCAHCGEELTTENTTSIFIKDKYYICFDCIKQKHNTIDNLERIYDPWKPVIQKKTDVGSEKHKGLLDRLINKPPKKPRKKYPFPEGNSYLDKNGKTLQCIECYIILTTTNAYEKQVKENRLTCNKCIEKQKIEREINPLYEKHKQIKSILKALYARRKVKQFTWEHVMKRFSVEGDRHGTLATDEGCNKLITLFNWEINKAKRRSKATQELYQATAFPKTHDRTYDQRDDSNVNKYNDDFLTLDPAYERYYAGQECKNKRDLSYDEIQLKKIKLPKASSANEIGLKVLEIQRQKQILLMLKDEDDINRQKKTIEFLYEDLIGNENMNWNKVFKGIQFAKYNLEEHG